MHIPCFHRLLLLFLLAIHEMLASAQLFSISNLPTQRQLPVANIHCILQDSEGYMWYGTTGGGLCRDDGYQIVTFGKHLVTALPDNNVTCLAEDPNGGICVGTHHGLYRVDKTSYRMLRLLDDCKVSALSSDRKGNLWVAIGSKVLRLSTDGKIRRAYTLRWKGKDASVTSFSHNDSGSLYVSVWQGGIFRYDVAKDYWKPCLWHYGYPPVKICDSPNGFFVGTWGGGIVSYDPHTGHTTPQPATMGGEQKQQVLDILRDSRQGIYWVTTMDDLFAYKKVGGRLQSLSLGGLLPDYRKILDQLEEDRDGNVWVAGFMPSTFIISNNLANTRRFEVEGVRTLTHYPLLADRVVADGDHYWIWQGRYGLTLYTPASGRVMDAGGMRFARCIEKRQGAPGIFAASGNTLYRLTATGSVPRFEKLSSVDDEITCVCPSVANEVFVATRSAVYRYGELGGALVRVARCSAPVVDMVASSGGIPYYIVDGQGVFANGRKLSASIDFSALALDDKGTLWLANRQGEVMIRREGQLHKDALASDEHGGYVKSMKIDGQGHLWVLTDQRVKEYNPQTRSLRVIRADDPFVNVNYFYYLSLADGGEMVVAGAGAFCCMPSQASLNHAEGEGRAPIVTSVDMGDTVCLVGRAMRTIVVPAHVSDLTVHLSTLDHLNASRITYAYCLKGSEAGWTYLPQGTNEVRLSNLSAGSHELLVKATDRYGCWGKETVCLIINHQQYWWATWWARMLFVVVGLALAYAVYVLGRRIRMLRLLQQKRKEIVLTQVELRPDELMASKIDKAFLQRAVDAVEQHLLDSDYNVERFSKDMCMSRMNLYRKMQSLTGLTPSDFLRDIRLKKAAQILEAHPEASVNEVAAKVGFATPSYFSKCFKQKFGVLPSAYGKKGAHL